MILRIMLNNALRPGAFCVTINVWDIDLEAFLDLKKKQGEDRLRAHSLYTAVNFDDVYMSRLEKSINEGIDLEYTLFDPYDAKELCDLFGDKFKEAYERLEEEFKSNPKKFNKNTKTTTVKDIARKMLTSYCNTGFPYWTFIDTINNNHEHPFLGKIRTGNLCVTGDTRVLTNLGYRTIRELEQDMVRAWNGENFTLTTFFNTGKGEVYEVKLSHMPMVSCTAEHKFFVLRDGKKVVVETTSLKEGDIIVEEKLPSLTITSDVGNRLESIFSQAGFIKNNPFNQGTGLFLTIRVSSYKEGKDLILDLQEVGIDSRYLEASSSYQMVVVNSENISKAIEKGLYTPSEEVEKLLGENKIYSKPYPPIRVVSVRNTKRLEITYCGTEPEKNKLMFDGILTGNCQEVMMPADDDEVAVCNLGSINVAAIQRDTNGDEEFKRLLRYVTRIGMRFLDNSVDVTVYPHPDAEKTQKQRRSTGLTFSPFYPVMDRIKHGFTA